MDAEPNLFARIWEFAQALWQYWWLVVTSVVLMVEQLAETVVPSPDWLEKNWPKDHRRKHIRLLSAAMLLVASFMAFDDVSTRNRQLISEVSKLKGERDEARRHLDTNINADQHQVANRQVDKKENIKLSFTAHELEERQKAISEIYSSLNDLDALSQRTHQVANLIGRNLVESGTRDTADKLSEYKKELNPAFQHVWRAASKWAIYKDIFELRKWIYYDIFEKTDKFIESLNAVDLKGAGPATIINDSQARKDWSAAVMGLEKWIIDAKTQLRDEREKYQKAEIVGGGK